MYTGPLEIKNTNCEKLLGIKVDSRLNFNDHLGGIIKKASCKINALSRTKPFIVVQLTTRLTVYTKESCVLYVVTLSNPSKIF